MCTNISFTDFHLQLFFFFFSNFQIKTLLSFWIWAHINKKYYIQSYFYLKHLLHYLFHISADQSITCFICHLKSKPSYCIIKALWKIEVTIFKLLKVEYQQKFESPPKTYGVKIFTIKTVTMTAQIWCKRISWNMEDQQQK